MSTLGAGQQSTFLLRNIDIITFLTTIGNKLIRNMSFEGVLY